MKTTGLQLFYVYCTTKKKTQSMNSCLQWGHVLWLDNHLWAHSAQKTCLQSSSTSFNPSLKSLMHITQLLPKFDSPASKCLNFSILLFPIPLLLILRLRPHMLSIASSIEYLLTNLSISVISSTCCLSC